MTSVWNKIVELWTAFLIWTGLKKLSFRDKLPTGAKEEFDKILHLMRDVRADADFMLPIENLLTPGEKVPCRSNLWIAEVEGLDSFLVSSFTPPSMIRVVDPDTAEESVRFTVLSLSAWDRVGSSTMAIFAKLMNGSETDMKVKIVDRLGKIIEVWKFRVRPVGVHPLTVLSYDGDESIKWQLECETVSWEIQVLTEEKNDSDTVN